MCTYIYIYTYIYTNIDNTCPYTYTRLHVFMWTISRRPDVSTNLLPCQAVELLRKRQMHQLVVQAGMCFLSMGTRTSRAKHLRLDSKVCQVGQDMGFLWCFHICSFNQSNKKCRHQLKCLVVFWHGYGSRRWLSSLQTTQEFHGHHMSLWLKRRHYARMEPTQSKVEVK